jgi:uncharacterized protein YqiB (DUF1249 family)
MGHLNPINKALCLEQICDSNFQKIFLLIPDLLAFEGNAHGFAVNNSSLYLEVIERTPYTMIVELSHSLIKTPDVFLEPAVKIRIYLDAKLAEVISDHARAAVSEVYRDASRSLEIMNYKWRLNYFLQKWLDHCLKKNYRFTNTLMYKPAWA